MEQTKSKYEDIKYDHRRSKNSYHHHSHKHHRRKSYSRSQSGSHNNHSMSHSKYKDRDRIPHSIRSRSRSRSREYEKSMKNHMSYHKSIKSKDYYKNNQYSSSGNRMNNNYNNNNSYIKSNSVMRDDYGNKFRVEDKKKFSNSMNNLRDKENDRYKKRASEYKDNKIEDRNITSSNKSKIVINLFDDKKENKENKPNNYNYYVENDNSPKNKFYYFITKNDKMKLIFRIYNTDNSSQNKDNNYTMNEIRRYNSIREDYWTIKFHHQYINPTIGGKVYLEIKVRKNPKIIITTITSKTKIHLQYPKF